jgi:hypothetical protein
VRPSIAWSCLTASILLSACATPPRHGDEDEIATYERQGLTHEQAITQVLADHETRHRVPPDLVNQAASDAGRRPIIARDAGTAAAAGMRVGF